jgi:hypothetical protein
MTGFLCLIAVLLLVGKGHGRGCVGYNLVDDRDPGSITDPDEDEGLL